MDYYEELKAIQSNWAAGRITKRTAIIEFEQVLRGVGFIATNYALNPETSDNDFGDLLRRAINLPQASLDEYTRMRSTERDAVLTKMFKDWKPSMYFCGVCHRPSPKLFNEVTMERDGNEAALVDLPAKVHLEIPLCADCCRVHVETVVEQHRAAKRAHHPDALPMNDKDRSFFAFYERQMLESD